ncbi:MAG: CHASE2 domain-containing protein, partial [Cyanobacteria bacterium P01_D01_bin.116]
MIRRLLDNFRVAFLNSRPGNLSVRDDTQAPQLADSTRDNLIQDSTPTSWWRKIFVTSLGVTVLVLGARELGWLQRWELRAYDQMTLLRPTEPPDKRILLVMVTEKDLQKYNNPLPDEIINQLLKKLQSYQPRVVGLQIKRPQQSNLATGIRNDNIIAACVFESMGKAEVPPPPNFPPENIAFSDLIPDNTFDNVVRRGLLFQTPLPNSKCDYGISFSSILAIEYLAKLGIKSTHRLKDKTFYLGKTPFPFLQQNSGGYINIEPDGYQILINYRNHLNVAKSVSLTEVLTDKVNANLIKDRLLIIGESARSLDPGRLTPYSTFKDPPAVPPVVIHAQITSQLISAVLDNRPLIWYFPEWLEAAWIWGWSLIGGILAWKVRRPVFLLIVCGITVFGLVGICYLLIVQAGWVPVVPTGLALAFTAIGVLGYTSYRTQLQT